MGHEPMNELEVELRKALERRPAPPSLKYKVMTRRDARRAERRHSRLVWWRRLAVAATLAGVLAGVLVWRNAEQQRKGEEARREVMIALRITNRALNQMAAQLEARNQDVQDRDGEHAGVKENEQ